MKRLFLLIAFIYYAANLYAMENNLYEKFKDDREIRIFLEDVVNETDSPAVKTDVFRNVFKETIEKRLEMKFAYTNDKKDADAVVIVRIKNYTFTANAMPFFFSTASLAADALTPKSSGKIAVDYEVIQPSDGRALLHYKNLTTEERRPHKDMEGDKGFVNSVNENVNKFIHKTFCKPH